MANNNCSRRLDPARNIGARNMREYLHRVLELTKPYRLRLVLGLACGFLAGLFAFALPTSLNLAIDAVFPSADAVPGTLSGSTNTLTQAGITNGIPAAAAPDSRTSRSGKNASKIKMLESKLPAPLRSTMRSLTQWFNPPGHPSTARKILVISFIPASMFLRSFLTYLNVYFLSWVGIRAANDLRVRLFQHLVHLPLQFFNRASTGDLMAGIEGAMAVNMTVKDSFGVIIREPITILVLIGWLVSHQPLLSLFTLLVFPICLIPVVGFGRKYRKSYSAIHAKYASLNNVMQESFTGIRVIKGFNLEKAMVTQFRQAVDAVTSFFMRQVREGELPGPLIEFIGSIGVALVFAYYAFVASSAEVAPKSGDMLGFFIAVFGLYQPVKNLSRLHHQLTVAKATVDHGYKLLDLKNSVPEPLHPKPLKAEGLPIYFKNVSFSYGEKPVLQNINLTIRPGQMVALVGRTGSGKTSIANLLLRFYDPTAGAILIGDTNLREVNSQALRANMAVVTQETILFNDTIRRNIALGRPGATDAEIEEAAKHAYAHGFITTEKPKGYETPVGEKGVNVSGGQRQRIAIARAILRNAPILILDEATSALDSEAERIVQAALEELMRGRTTICIAHRLSTIQKADLIVVLDAGRIVETGTHEELMQLNGLYRKLYEIQFEPGQEA